MCGCRIVGCGRLAYTAFVTFSGGHRICTTAHHRFPYRLRCIAPIDFGKSSTTERHLNYTKEETSSRIERWHENRSARTNVNGHGVFMRIGVCVVIYKIARKQDYLSALVAVEHSTCTGCR